MSVERVKQGVATATGLFVALGVKVVANEQHGDIDAVKLLGFLPLFRRNASGQARILGFRAKRLDR